MPEIKTRETVKDIKILDKAAVAGERMKQAFIRSKDTAQNLMDDGQVSPSEYAEDKIKYAAEEVTYDTGHTIKKETDKAVDKGREAFREHRREKRLERQEKKVDEAVRRIVTVLFLHELALDGEMKEAVDFMIDGHDIPTFLKS